MIIIYEIDKAEEWLARAEFEDILSDFDLTLADVLLILMNEGYIDPPETT